LDETGADPDLTTSRDPALRVLVLVSLLGSSADASRHSSHASDALPDRIGQGLASRPLRNNGGLLEVQMELRLNPWLEISRHRAEDAAWRRTASVNSKPNRGMRLPSVL